MKPNRLQARGVTRVPSARCGQRPVKLRKYQTWYVQILSAMFIRAPGSTRQTSALTETSTETRGEDNHNIWATCATLREGVNEKKTISFGHCPNDGGGSTHARIFGPLFRSAFLVNKKSLFLQKCQCIELLTVF